MTRPNSFKPALQLLEDRSVPDAAPVEPLLEDLPPTAPPAEAPPVAPPSDDANAVFVGDAPPTTADDTFDLLFSDLWNEEIVPTETVVEAWDEYEMLFAVWFEDEPDASAPEPIGDEPESPPTEVPDEATEPSDGADDDTVPISAAADEADDERGFWTRLGDFFSSFGSGFADEARDQGNGLLYQFSDPLRALEFYSDQLSPGLAQLRRLAKGEPDPILLKGAQIGEELRDDPGHGIGRLGFLTVELLALRRAAGAAGGAPARVPLAGAGPKVLPGATVPAFDAFKGPLALPAGANPKFAPVAIRKNGTVLNFENGPMLAPFGPLGALKGAELGAPDTVQSVVALKRELSIWLQTAGIWGVAPERIKWYRDEFAKRTTDADREALLDQLRTEVRGATPPRLTLPGAPGEGNPLPPSPVVGPPPPDAPQPQAQPQPATSGAGARKPPKGGVTHSLFSDTIFGLAYEWNFTTGEFELVTENKANVADVVQDHHAIPWNNSTFKHHEHKLVELAGNPSLKTLAENIRPLKGHSGRHSVAYHTEIQRRMNEAVERVFDKGQVAARQALLDVIKSIWADIESGKLRPYDHKDVVLP